MNYAYHMLYCITGCVLLFVYMEHMLDSAVAGVQTWSAAVADEYDYGYVGNDY